RMKIDTIAADADAIREHLRCDLLARLAGELHARIGANVLFENCELGKDAPRLADVRILGESIVGAGKIAAKPESFPAGAAVRTRRFGLHPIQERETKLLGAVQMRQSFLRLIAMNIAEPVVVLRPIDQRDIAFVSAGGEVPLVGYAPVEKQIQWSAG